MCNITILDHFHDSVASFSSLTRPHAQSATCSFGTHYNRSELTEPMTDVNYSPYPKIGLDGLVMAHRHWINRLIDPSCMFCDFGIFLSLRHDQFWFFGAYMNVQIGARKFACILKAKQGIVWHSI
jgi:hypothetical protein